MIRVAVALALLWALLQHPAVTARLAAFGNAWRLEAPPCVRVYGALWRPSSRLCDQRVPQ